MYICVFFSSPAKPQEAAHQPDDLRTSIIREKAACIEFSLKGKKQGKKTFPLNLDV